MAEFQCEQCGAELASLPVKKLHEKQFCPKLTATEPVAAEIETSNNGDQPTEELGRLTVPIADPDYFVSSLVAAEIQRVLALCEAQPENLALVGPKGSGKTALALQIAAKRQAPCYVANAYTQRSSDEWFGREGVSLEHGTYYVPSLFVEALETEGAVVIINDMALMQNKSIQNGLNDILDYGIRFAWVEALAATLGRPVRVAPRVLIIGTWNEGAAYTGNIMLSANLTDRFPNRIYMDYPPAEVQKSILMRKTGISHDDASRLSDFGARLRGLQDPVEVSMRGLIQAGRKMQLSANIHDALYYTIISGLKPESQEQALAALEGIYTTNEKHLVSTRTNQWEAWADGGEKWTEVSAEVKASWERAVEGWRPPSKAGGN
ncbi:hypothetical protein LCGC14_1776040 [marine sediment metagenome]|uniref:AAA+ ATPase domain-containing protein n=1 Tax=marine sediment metagenome TaxID=412755 RepID=A0A0F9GWV1_9ZZZZ